MSAAQIFAIVGSPVLHSASPALHNAAFAALGLDAAYVRLFARSADEALAAGEHLGFAGFNVTSPFKQEMAARMAQLSDEAVRTGAVNTVRLDPRGATGFNTDVLGVASAFEEAGVALQGTRAVVLGAGGAACAAVEALRPHCDITVVNRTLPRAEELARRAGCDSAPLRADALARLLPIADVVVSTLPSTDDLGPLRFKAGAAVLDAVYARETTLARAARAAGCRVISGRRWLLLQALAAFQIFTGRTPPADAMERALEASPRARPRGVALIGFSGAGKTRVAPRVAARLGFAHFDSDARVEARANATVAQIFAAGGEPSFRGAERAALRELPTEPCVVACGGGAVLDRGNVDILRERGLLVVWLGARLDVCLARLAGAREPRPLIDAVSRVEVAGRFERRRLTYARASDVVMDTEGLGEEQVADAVVRCFEEACR